MEEKQTLLAEVLELKADDQTPSVHGKIDGYSIIAVLGGDNLSAANKFVWSFIFGVKKRDFDSPLNYDEFNELRNNSSVIQAFEVNQNRLVITVNPGASFDEDKEKIKKAVNETIDFLKANGYEDACENGHAHNLIHGIVLDGVYRNLCDYCFNQDEPHETTPQAIQTTEKNSLTLGIIGALLGAILGGAVIVALYQLSYVASISGLIMAFATIKGYTLFGGKINLRSVVIMVVIMVIATYLADRLNWAIEIAQYFKVTVMQAFKYVHEIIDAKELIKNLGVLYLFVSLGAVPTLYRLIVQPPHSKKFKLR